MTYTRIIGTGSCLPARCVANQELEALVDTTDSWIRERSGIAERRVAAAGENCTELAVGSARQALEAAGLGPRDVDLIVLATSTPDRVFPSTACLVQDRLGCRPGIIAFDVAAACSGFTYALDVADRFIRTGGARRALVIGAEVFSRILNWNDRGTCVLFGDGAGAVVVEAADQPGILGSVLHADGAQEAMLNVPWGVGQGYDALTETSGKVSMRGGEVFKAAVRALGDVVDEMLERVDLPRDAIDWLVPHQANIRIIAATARKLGLPMDRVVVTVERHGNTSAASIPLALDEAMCDGRIRPGQLVLLEAFGAGFTWGANLIRF